MPAVPGLGDLLGALRAQADAFAELPATLLVLNRSIRGLAETVNSARETLQSVQRLAARLEAVVAEVEEPVRALAPGLARVAKVLDSPVVDGLPEALRTLQDDVLPLVKGMRDTQAKVAGIASSTDRMLSFMDETGSRLSMLPGAGLLRGVWPRDPSVRPAASPASSPASSAVAPAPTGPAGVPAPAPLPMAVVEPQGAGTDGADGADG